MDEFDRLGMEMGKQLGQLYRGYTATFAWLAPVLHLALLAVLALIMLHGNRSRTAFTLYFLLNYLWTLVLVGLLTSAQLVQVLGMRVLLFYGATPLFLALISYQWYRELRQPRLDLDLRHVAWWRYLIAVPIMVWALWYPPYTWGVGFHYDLRAFLFGHYGLMSCPLTMMALSILLLKYPAGNQRLFHLLTAYSVLAGAGMVRARWVPDIPFFLVGVIAVCVIVGVKLGEHFRPVAPAAPSGV